MTTQFKLGPLTSILVVAFLVLLGMALLPQISHLSLPSLRLLVVGFSGLTLGLGLWAIRKTNRRLAELEDVAKAIEEGNYEARAAVSGVDSVAALAAAINRMARRTQIVVRDLELRESRVRELATHDFLTGLANRRLFHEILKKEVAHARRGSEKVGVVLFDVDGFKAFNDSLGNVRGDHILQEVSRRILTTTRESDTVARIGDDEFGLIVTRVGEVENILEAIRRVFSAFEEPLRVSKKDIRVSLSAGLSVFPQHAREVGLLISRADSALTLARSQGGKCYRIFESRMERRSRDRMELEQQFPGALESGQMIVRYQPQVAVADGQVVGLEALVRWQHPRKGLLPAGFFIPILEQTGLMPELGRWLLHEICRQNYAWQAVGLRKLPISVNVSVRQFEADQLADVVRSALADSGLEPEFLHLEITESIAMHDVEKIFEVLSEVHRSGVKIHLDDFGTGYSSLSYLMRFPVDVVKIDRSFVAGLPDSQQSAAIVRATLALADSLGLEVIAEGVETDAQLQFLRQEGCQIAQGFLFGRAMPVQAIEALLNDQLSVVTA